MQFKNFLAVAVLTAIAVNAAPIAKLDAKTHDPLEPARAPTITLTTEPIATASEIEKKEQVKRDIWCHLGIRDGVSFRALQFFCSEWIFADRRWNSLNAIMTIEETWNIILHWGSKQIDG